MAEQDNKTTVRPARVRGALEWLGNTFRRLTLAMLLSILLHAGAIGIYVLVLLLISSATSPAVESREIRVSLSSAGESPEGPPAGSPAASAGQAPSPASPQTPLQGGAVASQQVEDIRQGQKGQENAVAEKAGERLKATTQGAAQEAKNQISRQYAKGIEDAARAIEGELARKQGQLGALRREARETIDSIAASKERRQQWQRWTVRFLAFPADMENAGGRMLVTDYPRKGDCTYVVKVATSPSRQAGQTPTTFLFAPADIYTLASFIAVCRSAGIGSLTGEFMPFAVFPKPFEDRLASLEREEMKNRNVRDANRIQHTIFDLHADGTVSLGTMAIE